MNMQKLMQEAQKMQAELGKTQKELENTEYEGSSALVKVIVNGKKEIKSLKINADDDILKDDVEMLEDMILIAVNEAFKSVDNDKEQKLSKYGSGLAGLM